MKIAIMQPYLFPYIGYFQLIAAVDLFVVYDNVKYTKKGWINRNRMLVNGQDAIFSLPLKKDSDFLDIRDRELMAEYDPCKLLGKFAGAYRKAPQFEPTYALIDQVLRHGERNLFAFIYNSLARTCEHLGLATPIRVSSSIGIDHGLRCQDKVLDMCEAVGATEYVNAIGGLDLYSRDAFRARGIELSFIRAVPFEYAQLREPFIPWLSIIDVLMFNRVDVVRDWIAQKFEWV